jgi:AraC-like DNA-binding protein
MKASFEDIQSKKKDQSFLAYSFSTKQFKFKWHYHPEYELTLITRGSGKRFVGDSYQDFTSGDLVLIGTNLPHTWVSELTDSRLSSAVVIQFSCNLIEPLLALSEFQSIKKMLSLANRGLHFSTKQSGGLITKISKLTEKSGVEKISFLLMVLSELAEQKTAFLSSAKFEPAIGGKNEKRINTVCEYIQKNSTKKFTLGQIAQLIHLSESAFCKFFKRLTGKTFSDYVNEVRIGHACQMLIETDKPIAEVAWGTGFESLTYFNRVFLKKKKMRPKEFRAKHFSG